MWNCSLRVQLSTVCRAIGRSPSSGLQSSGPNSKRPTEPEVTVSDEDVGCRSMM